MNALVRNITNSPTDELKVAIISKAHKSREMFSEGKKILRPDMMLEDLKVKQRQIAALEEKIKEMDESQPENQ